MTGGTHAGRTGWKHKEKGETEDQIYIILQKIKENGRVVKPEKVVRIDKNNYMPFIRATSAVQVVIEQKPKLQQKMSDLIKELVKLEVQPTEDFLVVFGYQWLTMWERKRQRAGVDFSHPAEEPQASDNEAEDVENID